jgi:glutathione S-transferase
MITVHHLNNSRSQRILWMLEELGVPYEVKRYQRQPSMQAPDELRKVHPLGKSPVITDGDKVLAESGAILEYLSETYGGGKFTPAAGTPERLQYTYFMHYAEGSLMPLLFMKLVFDRIPSRVPFFMRPVARAISGGANKSLLAPQLGNHFMFIEGELSRREWFAGPDFTAADIQMSFPLEAAGSRAPAIRGMPRIKAFLERIHARPAYKRALDKGGAYDFAN